MSNKDLHIQNLKTIFQQWSSETVKNIEKIAAQGSDRNYYRIWGEKSIAIGVHHTDQKENEAFVSFTKSFHNLGLKVPELYDEDLINNIYLIEDLGDLNLFSIITNDLMNNEDKIIEYYKMVLRELQRFQIMAANEIDYSKCYPRAKLDEQSIMWDLNYFKYYFLKTLKIPFNEQLLENDFSKFASYLMKADNQYFVYRDFQARNIIIKDKKAFFIDYQGGRKGALQYDVASLLFQVKADLSNEIREKLLNFYVSELDNYPEVNTSNFKKYFYSFVYIRLLQVLGAYGFRGLIEQKTHFIKSIPFAIKTLNYLLKNHPVEIELTELTKCLNKISKLKNFDKITHSTKLKVKLTSFAYKHGIPEDKTGHGEGFVFDCRALPNPGRLDEYKRLNGNDEEVVTYLEQFVELEDYLKNVFQLVSQSINNYIERDFSNLTINFGCTGGQHRSVYCANALYKYIEDNYDIQHELEHTQQANWPLNK